MNSMILVMSLAYLKSTLQGNEINRHQGQKYVCRPKKAGKIYRRRSTFCLGLDGKKLDEKLGKYHQ
ncbi:hypothetical protein [Microcoleus sp. herbarium19]|uniref:hypothetical protein n=1 Tax=Microcoleus sp. herbarium19 TaxID=3055440 RepID=UPI002FD656F4